jgi:Zn-dependent protease
MKWKLGDIAGIGVYVHWSFWILPGWILLSTLSGGGGLFAGLSTVLFVFAVFGCVLLHEVGHALMARHYRIGTRDITLYPIGGVASLERMPKRPTQELAIALAGPAVNVLIALALFAILFVTGIGPQASVLNLTGGNTFLLNLMLVNVALVVFNLLPAFPMDGGRVLRAFLAMQLPHERATVIAARAGQVIAVLLGLVGLLTGGTLIFVALFVFLAAQAELRMAQMQSMRGAFSPTDEPWARPNVGPCETPTTDVGIVWVSEVRTQPGDGPVVRTFRWPPVSR